MDVLKGCVKWMLTLFHRPCDRHNLPFQVIPIEKKKFFYKKIIFEKRFPLKQNLTFIHAIFVFVKNKQKS